MEKLMGKECYGFIYVQIKRMQAKEAVCMDLSQETQHWESVLHLESWPGLGWGKWCIHLGCKMLGGLKPLSNQDSY